MASRRFGAPDKQCSCGRLISDAEWERLPLLGYQVFPSYEDDPGEVLEMRNDVCGSTLTKMMVFTPEALERGAELELGRGAESRKRALSIAADHLKEDPLHYQKHVGLGALNPKDPEVYEADEGDRCDACGYVFRAGELMVLPRGRVQGGAYCSVKCSASDVPSDAQRFAKRVLTR
jgi:hypothetical protein